MVATIWPVAVSGGELADHTHHGSPVYYEVAASIITLFLQGNLLQARATARTQGAIQALIALSPRTARVERFGMEMDLHIDKVRLQVFQQGNRVPDPRRQLAGRIQALDAFLDHDDHPRTGFTTSPATSVKR